MMHIRKCQVLRMVIFFAIVNVAWNVFDWRIRFINHDYQDHVSKSVQRNKSEKLFLVSFMMFYLTFNLLTQFVDFYLSINISAQLFKTISQHDNVKKLKMELLCFYDVLIAGGTIIIPQCMCIFRSSQTGKFTA